MLTLFIIRIFQKTETLTEAEFRERFGAPPPPFVLQEPLPIQDVSFTRDKNRNHWTFFPQSFL